jgi:hypothetical protein
MRNDIPDPDGATPTRKPKSPPVTGAEIRVRLTAPGLPCGPAAPAGPAPPRAALPQPGDSNSDANYEACWADLSEPERQRAGLLPAFEDRHASTAPYIDTMRPRCVAGCP